ncbi:hypothetical protein MD484_g2056, partial [Candolleomyces efflorescens]
MASNDQDGQSKPLCDTNLLKEIAKKDLVNAMNAVNGAKTLVLDPDLAGPLGLVIEVSLLKQHGVDKMFWLEPGPLTSTSTNIVYLCRPKIKHVKIIADQIKRHAKEAKKHTYTLLLIPRVSTLVSRILEEEGVLGERLANLLTRQSKLSTSPTENALSSAANVDSLIVLDRKVDMITPLLTELTYEGLIDELIGIKNSHVELPAALVNPPATNPASSSSASTSATPIVNVKKDSKKKHHLTTATDPLYAELRDLNFSSVGRKLNTVARRLDEDYKTNLQTKTVAQLRDFVGKLGGLQTEHQSLRLHTGISELILPLTRTEVFNKSLEIQQNLLASYEVPSQVAAIEELIAQGADMQIVVRLLCLASITAGGIKAKTLENLKREILQSYGYEYLPLLLALAQPSLAVLLPNPLPPSIPASTKYPFSLVRKSLRLLLDDNPEALEEVENDIGFVYSGWAPISIRLVQCVAQKGGVISNPAEKEKNLDEQSKSSIGKVQAHPIVGWRGFEDIVSAIPGDTVAVEAVRRHDDGIGPALTPMSASSPLKEQTTTTVVYFLGGCTYTEIAALRWVGRQNKGKLIMRALDDSLHVLTG